LAKKKGGIGLNTTGVSRRRFLPNIQRVKVLENGGALHRRVCTACIKSGKIVKA
jgi:large subunit ribosomal protein L28